MTYEHFLTSSAMFSFEVAISSTVSTAKKTSAQSSSQRRRRHAGSRSGWRL